MLITISILIAGLWPFNFHPVNKVDWVKDGNGITFNGQAIVFSPGLLAVLETASKNGAISIELYVQPHKETSSMLSTLLTFYDQDLQQITFGQWNKEFIIRIHDAKIYDQGVYREIGVENALNKDTTHLITVTSNKEATAIYSDGKHVKRFEHFSLIPDKRSLSGRLILGNSPEGTNSWNGTITGLAIYDRALNNIEALEHFTAWQRRDKSLLAKEIKPTALYLFDEHSGNHIQEHSGSGSPLLVPAIFEPLRRTILGMPTKGFFFSRSNLMDIAVNFLGFIPFGFVLSAWIRQTVKLHPSLVYGISLLLGFCLSLAIELMQIYLPTRDSSLMDVISNTLGTAVGVLLFKYILPTFY